MSSPTLTFTPAMFHASRKGIKDTTRRVHAFPPDCISKYSTPFVPGLKGTPVTPPHQPGQIKPMVTTWAVHESFDTVKPIDLPSGFEDSYIWFNDGTEKPSWCGKSRPGRFLPKTLYALAPQVEILTVTHEFLLDITEASARREGIAQITKDGGRTLKYGLADRDGSPGSDDHGWDWKEWCPTAREAYLKLWDSINAARDEGRFAAKHNPAVWVITYRLL